MLVDIHKAYSLRYADYVMPLVFYIFGGLI